MRRQRMPNGPCRFLVQYNQGTPDRDLFHNIRCSRRPTRDTWLRSRSSSRAAVGCLFIEAADGLPQAELKEALSPELADELDADWSAVNFEEAPAHKEFANYALAREYSTSGMEFPAWLIDSVDGLFD